MVPTTVTMAVQVDVLPHPSFTVSVTVFAPILPQLKLVFDRLNEAMPLQSSVEPLSTIAGAIVAEPPLSVTVTFLHLAVGFVKSCTVMVCSQLLELPQPSVAVHVRVMT
jgi:hypothetical protein